MRSLWMLVAAFMFAGMGVLVKLGAENFSSVELVFYRSLFGVVVTYFVVHYYRYTLLTPHWRVHCWRGLFGLGGMLLFFYCITQLPLATAVSLNYSWPLFLALFSTVILKEHLHWPLVGAIAIGFIGVLLLLRPTLDDEHWVAGLTGLASGFFAAVAYLNVRQLGNLGESEWRVVFYFTLISTLTTGIWLLLTAFSPITSENIMLLLGLGVTATLAQLAMTRAYRTGKTLVVSSLGYSTVLFAGLWGILLWNEDYPLIAWLGMGLIVLGGSLSGIFSLRLLPKSAQK